MRPPFDAHLFFSFDALISTFLNAAQQLRAVDGYAPGAGHIKLDAAHHRGYVDDGAFSCDMGIIEIHFHRAHGAFDISALKSI